VVGAGWVGEEGAVVSVCVTYGAAVVSSFSSGGGVGWVAATEMRARSRRTVEVQLRRWKKQVGRVHSGVV
jgi:hypothetical protein